MDNTLYLPPAQQQVAPADAMPQQGHPGGAVAIGDNRFTEMVTLEFVTAILQSNMKGG